MPEPKPRQTHHAPLWGIFLLFLGILLLLQNFGVLPWGLWGTLWRFWPVLLIIIGLDILAGRYNPWLAGILALAVLGACLGVAIWQHGLAPGPAGTSASEYSQPLGDMEKAQIKIDFVSGSLDLAELPSRSPNLVEVSSKRDSIEADFEHRGKVGQLHLSTKQDSHWKKGGDEWEVKLTRNIPLALEIKSAAANLDSTWVSSKQPSSSSMWTPGIAGVTCPPPPETLKSP